MVPGNAAPREAACAPVPPTDWFGTILGRVIGNWAFRAGTMGRAAPSCAPHQTMAAP